MCSVHVMGSIQRFCRKYPVCSPVFYLSVLSLLTVFSLLQFYLLRLERFCTQYSYQHVGRTACVNPSPRFSSGTPHVHTRNKLGFDLANRRTNTLNKTQWKAQDQMPLYIAALSLRSQKKRISVASLLEPI